MNISIMMEPVVGVFVKIEGKGKDVLGVEGGNGIIYYDVIDVYYHLSYNYY